jgi:thiamine biosynthesis lipoprotein
MPRQTLFVPSRGSSLREPGGPRPTRRRSSPSILWGLSAITITVAAATGCGEPVHMERKWPVMGTHATVQVYTQTRAGAEQTLEEIRTSLEHVDDTMSNWKPDSELSRLNRSAAQEPFVVEDPDLLRCIRMARKYARATGGAFDPTIGPLMQAWGFRPNDPRVPDEGALADALGKVGWDRFEIIDVAQAVRFKSPGVEIDLGGIARGYALDVAARRFARVGCIAGLIDLGGDLYAWGQPPDSSAWVVGVPSPEDPAEIMATVELASRAISTSGNYEQSFAAEGRTFGHIMAADSGRPAKSDIVSATAIADGAADADALSTAMFVVGSKGSSEYLRRARRVEAILLVEGRDGRSLLISTSLKGKVEIDAGFADSIEGRVRYVLPPIELETADVSDLWDRLLE